MACDCSAELVAVGLQIYYGSDKIADNIDKHSRRLRDDLDDIHKTLYGSDLKGETNTYTPTTGGGGGGGGGGGTGGGGGDPGPGTPGAFNPIRYCHWQAPEYGNQGENAWTRAFQLASIAIAVANAAAQSEINDKLMDLADSWYRQAKYKWDRYSSTYKPLEIRLLNEVAWTPIPVLDCNDAASRARQSVNSADDQARAAMGRMAQGLRLCVDPALSQSMNLQRNISLVDAHNYNYTDARWWRDYLEDRRWNRRSNVLNLGRNLDSLSLQYGQVANAIYGQVGAQIDRAANGLMTAMGYFGARNDTFTPMTYLASGGRGGQNQLVSVSVPGGINPTSIGATG